MLSKKTHLWLEAEEDRNKQSAIGYFQQPIGKQEFRSATWVFMFKFKAQQTERLYPGGVRTTTAMHCGFKIFKMATKVEKSRRLYALFFNRYSSFLRQFFSISQANIFLDFFCEERQINILHFNLKRGARRFLL